MVCFYCGHELNMEDLRALPVVVCIGSVPTLEQDIPCRHCGASYRIEQQVTGLPNIGEEMLRKIMASEKDSSSRP